MKWYEDSRKPVVVSSAHGPIGMTVKQYEDMLRYRLIHGSVVIDMHGDVVPLEEIKVQEDTE